MARSCRVRLWKSHLYHREELCLADNIFTVFICFLYLAESLSVWLPQKCERVLKRVQPRQRQLRFLINKVMKRQSCLSPSSFKFCLWCLECLNCDGVTLFLVVWGVNHWAFSAISTYYLMTGFIVMINFKLHLSFFQYEHWMIDHRDPKLIWIDIIYTLDVRLSYYLTLL